jgi:hypothetical protein
MFQILFLFVYMAAVWDLCSLLIPGHCLRSVFFAHTWALFEIYVHCSYLGTVWDLCSLLIPGHCLRSVFFAHTWQSSQTDAGILIYVKHLPLPSTSFWICYSQSSNQSILYSEIPTASLNQIQINTWLSSHLICCYLISAAQMPSLTNSVSINYQYI